MIRSYNQVNENDILNKLRNYVRKPMQQDPHNGNQFQKYEFNKPLRNIGEITSKSTLLGATVSQPTTKRDYGGYNYQSKYQSRSVLQKQQNNVQFRHHSIRKNSIGKENSIMNDKNQFLIQANYRFDKKKNRVSSVFEKPTFEGISLGSQNIKQVQYKRQRKQFLSEAETKLNQFQRKLQMVKNQGLNSLSPINTRNIKVIEQQNNQQQSKNSYEELKTKYSNERNSQNYNFHQNYTPRNINLKNQQLKYQLQSQFNFNKPLKNVGNIYVDAMFKSGKHSDNIEIHKTQQQILKKSNKNYNQTKCKIQQFVNKPFIIQPYQNKSSFAVPYKIQQNNYLNFSNQSNASIVKSSFQTFRSTFQSTTIEGNQKTLSKLKKINDLNDKINQRIRNIIQTFQNKYKNHD